ncbi:MAG TPA: hypothetical protein VFK06_17730 [Candidatus Angelobacter sp.]|nr:hypothetical protein [Candidatus Angelobacter sp.]
MSTAIGFVPRSDTEVLDCIEDFLVNNFGVDERKDLLPHEASQMLEHIANLVELRRGIAKESSSPMSPAARNS